jgi:beta-glucuronidase
LLKRRRFASALGVLALSSAVLLATGAAGSARGVAALAAASQRPTPGAVYEAGPSGRYTLGGTWLFRYDSPGAHFENATSASGWSAVSVPNAWNAGKQTAAAYAPQVAWYRKDFVLPSNSPSDTWIVRFESVNNTATIWLNGHLIGTHTGAFLAFEVALPAADLQRSAVNRLVVRVSDAHSLSGLPPVNRTGPGGVVGGWWNYGGLLREVYLRRVTTIDMASVQVLPRLTCASCAARIDYTVSAHNYSASSQRVSLSASYGGVVASLGTHAVAAGGSATFSGSVAIADPQLWSPASPHLYDVTIDASAGGRRLQRYTLESGIRSVSVSGGHLYLNYAPVHLRGVGLVEDSPSAGSALSPAAALALISDAKALGATIVRSQYPLSAYEEQLADQMGIMLWSEIPVYQVHDSELPAVTPAAVALLRENILQNGNHPSIVTWSIANELDPVVGPAQSTYIADAVAAAHALDPTRPVALAYQGYPGVPCQAGYKPLALIGINDYFGWYAGPGGEIADPSLISSYLEAEHSCYPHQAIMISEFGAEANRSGPVDERGTYEYQSEFITNQLAAIDAEPWLSGAIYWALTDFLVRPGWSGGNPYPTPPLFSKGLIGFDGTQKPAWALVRAAYTATTQVG